MSILGRHTAVVSLGCSCQVARQIKEHAPLLSDLTGDALKRSRFPFDWLIAPPEGIGAVLDGEGGPTGPEEVEFHPEVFKKAVFWKSRQVYFWHDFLTDGKVDLPGTFEENREKYRHAFNKFRGLESWARRVFVLANTQNNLDDVRARAQGCDFDLSAERVGAIRARLDVLFPQGRNELVVVAYRSRLSDDPLDWPEPPHLLERDGTDWEGDDTAWAGVFRRHFATVPA